MRRMDFYPQTIAGAGATPYGQFKDESAPAAGDGTTVLSAQLQDVSYALYQVLQLANITPSGNLEDGTTVKQFISALSIVGVVKWNQFATYAIGNLSWQITGSNVFELYHCILGNTNQALSNATYWTRVFKITTAGIIDFDSLYKDGVEVNAVTAVTGTIAHGGTIPLPSGYLQSECVWMVGLGYGSVTGSHPDGVYYDVRANASRVVTAIAYAIGSGTDVNVNANYIIIGQK